MRLGQVLFLSGRPEDALTHFEKALTIKPDNVEALNSAGNALRALGRLDAAIAAFEKAIASAPRNGIGYYNLAVSRRFTAADPHFAAMKELARGTESASFEEQIALHFALGKAFADLGDHQQSFRHLLQGNSLKRQQIDYDEAKTLNQLKAIQDAFNAEMIRSKQGLGDPSTLPVFIIGMPRSGTTLVEQILASHPKVFGAGELREFGKLTANISGPNDSKFPEAVATMSGAQLREFGAKYVQALRSRAVIAERITDKMPIEFSSCRPDPPRAAECTDHSHPPGYPRCRVVMFFDHVRGGSVSYLRPGRAWQAHPRLPDADAALARRAAGRR